VPAGHFWRRAEYKRRQKRGLPAHGPPATARRGRGPGSRQNAASSAACPSSSGGTIQAKAAYREVSGG